MLSLKKELTVIAVTQSTLILAVFCFPDSLSYSCPALHARSSLPTLFELFLANLADNIPSVRQGAASALASVATVYGEW